MQTAKSNRSSEGSDYGSEWAQGHADLILAIGRITVEYYARCGRDLPWRRTRDAYQIFIAEMLLQKTAVKPVLFVWAQLVSRYPTIAALAGASLEDIEAIILPLGIHKRARALHEAANIILREWGGAIPASRDALESLPGVGNYTAAAVLSFAYDVPIAAIDATIARVYIRVAGFSVNTLRQAIAFARVVGQLVVGQTPWKEVNFGLLDLAAQICRVKPQCHVCPLVSICQYSKDRPA